ncbi:VC0807 family protein [Clostridium tyrobutyricum]|uniref:VC0807 family protein n=1 Tax=Clostridium tyrobutyricum TaxID=1519 RepID=UPI0011C92AF2|nr:VC0807 family protein [Clostridium tyrobutyricum]
MIKSILNKDFIVSAIIPVIIFSIFSKFGVAFQGIILSGIWSIGVVAINFIKTREINALAIIAGIFSVVGLVGTIISKNPTFYLICPIVQDILCAMIFFLSLLFKRSLIQIIVEQSYLKNAPDELKKNPKYKSVFQIITIVWGILNISQAIVRMILLHSVSMSSYYAISTIYGSISTPLILAFSIAFPRYYWRIATDK